MEFRLDSLSITKRLYWAQDIIIAGTRFPVTLTKFNFTCRKQLKIHSGKNNTISTNNEDFKGQKFLVGRALKL
jgi:hypothetical protein